MGALRSTQKVWIWWNTPVFRSRSYPLDAYDSLSSVAFAASGYVGAALSVDVAADVADADVALVRVRYTVRGAVTDADDGEPIFDARVSRVGAKEKDVLEEDLLRSSLPVVASSWVDYHRREQRPVWRQRRDWLDAPAWDLSEDERCLGGCSKPKLVQEPVKRGTRSVFELSFSTPQITKLQSGDAVALRAAACACFVTVDPNGGGEAADALASQATRALARRRSWLNMWRTSWTRIIYKRSA